nr:chromo domain protein LHP1-like [Tanacetum cinerariifolium]
MVSPGLVDATSRQVRTSKTKRKRQNKTKTLDLEQPRVQNDVTDVGNEYDEMYGEDYEDYEEEEFEKPKLADGFYQIEAVRKKRVRNGKKEYLLKRPTMLLKCGFAVCFQAKDIVSRDSLYSSQMMDLSSGAAIAKIGVIKCTECSPRHDGTLLIPFHLCR